MIYTIENNVMTIKEGVKEIPEINFSKFKIEKLILSSSVESIEAFAFYESGVKEIEFNNNLKCIGNFAFAYNNIENIILPNKLEVIKKGAFLGNKIKQIDLPVTLQELGENAFEKNKLTEIKLPSNITTIEKHTFKDNKITTLNLDGNITKIKDHAFENNKIEKLIIPNNITEIGKYAFSTNKINELIILANINEITEGTFSHNNLENLDLPESIEIISDSAFAYNIINKLVLNKVRLIGESAFLENKIKELILSDSLKVIGAKSFKLNKIEDLVIPENVTIIDKRAFENNKIKDLLVKGKLATIGDSAFLSNKLTNINLNAEKIESDAFTDNPLEKVYLNNDITLGWKAFSTKELIIDNITITNQELLKFNTNNVNRIITFKKNIKDYNIMKIEKDELVEMPIDIEIYKQYKSNYKKYSLILEEANIEKSSSTFRLAFLLGIFNNHFENTKDYLLFLHYYNEDELYNIINKYNITKYNKRLAEITKEFINSKKEPNVFKDFLKNYKSNLEKILIKKKYQISKDNTLRLKQLSENKDTSDIIKSLEYQKKNLKNINYDEVIDYYKETIFDIKAENIRLKEITLLLSSYVSSLEFNYIQSIYEERTADDELYFKNFSGKQSNYEYEWLNSDDPINFVLGYLVDCCAKICGKGMDILIQSVINPRIKTLVIRNNNEIIGKTTAYFNEDYLLCNNIEIKNGEKNLDTVFKIIVEALKEQAAHLGINKVNIGLSNNDLINEIENSEYEIITKDLLENYKYKFYIGDASTKQVKILKEKELII